MSTEAPPPHEPRVKLRWERVPDWDDPEGYPETPEAFHAALKQRVREYYIAQEEEREFDRVYKWCLQKSGNNRHEECREFRKYRMNRIHWPLGLPPAVRDDILFISGV